MDQVAQIREKIDIVSLLSEYLPLKKLGRNFKTTCPFHQEKSPSFVVSPERQIWHCFGCQKGGDVYTFLMEYENLEFPEALRLLGKRAGIELEQYSGQAAATSKKEQIYKINKIASEFYHYILTKHPAGQKALKYLIDERKISLAVINTYMIGCSPKSSTTLVDYLITKKKYNREDVIDSGLTSFSQGRLADFFRNRLMFPLLDHRENVIGFSGRVLDESETSGGKYINTRETLVYHKGDVFFGLNSAKTHIKKENRAIIMEGEFDVMSSFQEGITNAIAVKGTALTEHQVSLLSRFCSKVSLCFDQDSAGLQALSRSVPLLEKKGFTITVIAIPGEKDPDDVLKTDPYGFKQAIKHDIGVYDFLIDTTIASSGNSVEGKKRVSETILPFLQTIDNEIIKEHYMRLLAARLVTSYESIQKQMEKRNTPDIEQKIQKEIKEKISREEMLEEYLLSVVIQSPNPKKSIDAAVSILSTYLPKQRAYQKLLYQLVLHGQKNELFDIGQFANGLSEELLKNYDTSFLYPIPKFSDESEYLLEVEKTANELRLQYIRSKMKLLSDKMKEKELKKEPTEQEDEALVSLQEEFSLLSEQLQNSLGARKSS